MGGCAPGEGFGGAQHCAAIGMVVLDHSLLTGAVSLCLCAYMDGWLGVQLTILGSFETKLSELEQKMHPIHTVTTQLTAAYDST